jgi:DNA-binding response OmpR family regulator
VSLVLVVDDLAAIREPIAAALRLAGYQTLCAADGREALRAAWRHKPDLILLDLSMPVMDGLECLRALRLAAKTANVPVILLTGEADAARVAAAAKLRVKYYLLKSAFSLPELLKRVKQHVREAAGKDTARASSRVDLPDQAATAGEPTGVPPAA